MAITTQFCTGFEHDFTGTGTPGLAGVIKGGGLWDAGPTSGTEWAIVSVSPTPRNGSNCAQLVRPANTAKFLTKNVTGSATKVVLRLGIMLSARPASGTPIIMYGGASGATFNLTASSTGVLTLQAGTGTGRSSIAIDTTSWHLLEMQIDVHANPWTIDWKLDGVAQTQATNAATATTLATISLGTYFSSTQSGYTCNYDDFIFGTYTGASPSSTEWYGDGKTLGQFAGSDGTHVDVTRFAAQEAGTAYAGTITNAWSNLTAAGWTDTRSTTKCVSMAAAYVSGATPYMEFAPTTTAQTGSANAVYAVLNQSAGSTTSNLCGSIIVNSGGTATTLWGALTPVGSMADWSEITCFFRAAVVTAPVAGWTATEVNALRWRFGGVSNDVAPRPEVQGLMLEVDWPAGKINAQTVGPASFIGTSSFGPTMTNKPISASGIQTGSITRLTNKAATLANAVLSPTFVKKMYRSWSASLASVGTLVSSHAYARSISASLGSVGSNVRQTLKALSGSSTSTGTISKSTAKPLSASFASSGATTKQTNKALAAVWSQLGDVATNLIHGAQVIPKALSGSLVAAGSMTNKTLKSFTASLASTVTTTRSTLKAVAGSLIPAPIVTRMTSHNLSGTPPTYALVGTAGAENTTGVTGGDLNNLAWGTGENRTANNLLVLAVQCYGTATLPSAPSGWSISIQQAGTACSASIFHKIAAGSDAAPTVTGVTGGVLNGNLTEFSGNATTSPVDQINSSASASSPVVVTMPGTDATSGELTLCTVTSAYSPTTAINPITLTCNNGSTHGLAQNPSTATNHYATFYTITTSKSSADAWTYTANTITNLTGQATVAVSYKIGQGAPTLGLGGTSKPMIVKLFTAAAASAGSLVRSVSHGINGALVSTGSLVKKTSKFSSASLGFAGNAAKQAQKFITAAISSAGSISTHAQKFITAAVSSTGSIVKQTNKFPAASLSLAGSVVNQTQKLISAALAYAGHIDELLVQGTRVIAQTVGPAALNLAGAINNRTQKTLSAALASSGTVSRFVSRLLSASIAPVGTLARLTAHGISGALQSVGSLTKSTAKTLTASCASAVTFTRNTAKSATANLPSVGSLAAATSHLLSLAANLITQGSLSRSVNKVLSATYVNVVTMTKNIAHGISTTLNPQSIFFYISGRMAVFMANLGTEGALAKQTTNHITAALASVGTVFKRIPLALQAALASSGVMDAALVFLRRLEETMFMLGSNARTRINQLSGTIYESGQNAAQALYGLLFESNLAETPTLTKQTRQSVRANLASAGATVKRATRTLKASLASRGTLVKQGVHAINANVVLTANTIKKTLHAIQAELPSTGDIGLLKVLHMAFNSAVSFAGSISKQTSKSIRPVLTTVGVITRKTTHSFQAVLPSIGSALRAFPRMFQAALASSGNVATRAGITRAFQSTVRFGTSLSRGVGKNVNAVLDPIGSVTKHISLGTPFEAAINLISSFGRTFPRIFQGDLPSAGEIARVIGKPFKASIAMPGGISRGVAKGLRASIGWIGRVAEKVIFGRKTDINIVAYDSARYASQSILTNRSVAIAYTVDAQVNEIVPLVGLRYEMYTSTHLRSEAALTDE